MANEKYVAFIEKLIEMTKMRKLAWAYLDKNDTLCKGMEWKTETRSLLMMLDDTISTKHFDSENSFVCRRGSTYVVLLMKSGVSVPALYVVPNTYKGVVVLRADDYGEYITRLFNLVKSGFPHADTFIDEFLAEE